MPVDRVGIPVPAERNDNAGRVTITIPAGRPTTVNASRRMHPYERAKDDEQWRYAGKLSYLQQHARRDALSTPIAECVTVTATPIAKDGRSMQDTGACYPSVKAAIDGLVDARLLRGDTGKHVAWIKLCAPEIRGWEGLELVIEKETPC